MKKLFLTTITAIALIFANSAIAKTAKFTVKIKDHKFEPDVIEVPANTKFKLIVENLDKTAEEFESHDLRKEKIIAGGKKVTILVKPLKVGEYKFVGEFHEDTAKGKIIVK